MKPCPLCGSTDIACFAEECGDDYDNVPTFRAVVGCCGCREEGCDPSYDEEPCFGIEAYFRADHPLVRDCEDPWDIERVLAHHMAAKWNRRAGRTCRDIGSRGETPAFKCSECGCELDLEGAGFEPTMWVGASAAIPRFCPNCGARVMEP